MSYQEWTYHGFSGPGRGKGLQVELPECGPTERQDLTVLRSLRAEDAGWGWNGGSTSRAAARILADALELGDPDEAGMGVAAGNETLTRLREDFCDEVLMQMAQEWWLSRTAVLRWVLGWYTQLDIRPMPAVLRRLPAPGTIHQRRYDLPAA